MRPATDREIFRSTLRGTWLTAVLGLMLLIGLTIVALTGLTGTERIRSVPE